MTQIPRRPIRRLLVSNRGEIATRILSTARELDIETYAVYTTGDASHAYSAAHAIQLPSPASYVNIADLVDLVQKHRIDAVHPGYGFLSESPEFAKRMWEEAGTVVIGPGWEILEQTGHKLRARELAAQCDVPISPALEIPTNNPADISAFAARNGLPIMIKAVDSGGGRGIRLIRKEEELISAAKRAIEESPSRQVFAEKAAIDGFRHIEVQIVGDGRGGVCHLFDRECSIQRRYQKIVEIAPSTLVDRELVSEVIGAAVRIARKVKYHSLGTFEFLVHPSSKEYYFLEINPRLQVEHTITESICGLDIVKIQLLLAQGSSLADAGLSEQMPLPRLHSIQLRLTAEDVQRNWSLSIGKIKSFQFPTGNGIRIDTHLTTRCPTTIGADFDSLVAKIIITAPSWPAAVTKAARALQDTSITGIATNLSILRAIVASPAFASRSCHTQWLESNQPALLRASAIISATNPTASIPTEATTTTPPAPNTTNSTLLFRRGDAWTITLSAPERSSSSPAQAQQQPQPQPQQQQQHHLKLTRPIINNFPASLSAEIAYTTPTTAPTPYHITLTATSASATSTLSPHRRGNPADPTHVLIPFAGRLVELAVEVGDVLAEGEVVAVVRQMKMELEVRARRGGRVVWVLEAEEGEEVGEGTLAAVVEEEAEAARLGAAKL